MLPLKFFDNIFSFDVLGLKKTSKFYFLKNFKPRIFIFEYFPKISSEMDSTHPYYPILIPNTSKSKFFKEKNSQGYPQPLDGKRSQVGRLK